VSEALGVVAPLAVAIAFAGLGLVRPGWLVPALLALVPLQVRIFPDVEVATLALIGGMAARTPQILRVAARDPVATAVLAAFPLWIAASALWARQPSFVAGTLAKWLALTGAALLAAADDETDPRPVVIGALTGAIPAALWALGERLLWIPPRGAPRELEAQLIRVGDLVRGRALFHHPNKLAEFLEQVGLWLAALGFAARGICRAARFASVAGFAIAVAGIWGTGSMGGLGVILAGALLLAAFVWLPRAATRWAGPLAVVAAVGAAVVVWLAYERHGGIGSREDVYRFALGIIGEQPWLGLGAGNWPLAVGSAPLSVSRYWFRNHPHSLPLMIVAEVGLIGLALAVLFFAVPLWIAARRLPLARGPWRAVGMGAIAAVLALLAHGLVNYFLRHSVNGITTGLMFGLALGAGRRPTAS
jgi:O-antigen ligase